MQSCLPTAPGSPRRTKSTSGSLTCPHCWRSDAVALDVYGVLNAAGFLELVLCERCARRHRRAGGVVDYIGPFAA